MEEPLLCRRNLEEEKRKITWSGFAEELKAVSYMAVPMVAVSVSHYCLQVITMIMVGHLGELPLSGCALGVSFANVTGFSFIFGIAGALETLCGQAYGAQQYQKLGSYTYCSILSLYPICIPICFSWIFMDKLLVSLGQNPEISVEAGRYAIWLIPALLAYPILQSLIRYLQCQSLVLPMFLSSSAAVLLHTCLCWILTYKTSMGIAGGALSTGLALWFNVTLLVIYMRYSSACEKSRAFVFKDVLSCVKEIFSYGVPSAAMICLEWWSFELLILLSGLLPDSMLETSVLSICTRVSNELGAGNPEAARLSVIVATVIGLIEPIMVVTVFLSWRHVFGYIFSNEVEVVNYIAQIIPLLCISVFMDSLQAVLSGVARGTGWQHIGAYVNLGAYYLVGIPVAACLCFVAKWRGKGLWTGIVSGTTVQALVLAIVTASINWQKQANNARERIQEKPVRANNGAA
ncbi:protein DETOXIFICATION 3-like isoform X2 [Hibiscus syriacus]|uniref:protein DETOXIFICATION 3-like isoform X2 n=1 Tax=Hibiscus syriacus TaxID=106335 RepID=UPI001922E26E|nr:protein DETOXIFICATION 3-like isoform X2 [Hibiscus syriacus]